MFYKILNEHANKNEHLLRTMQNQMRVRHIHGLSIRNLSLLLDATVHDLKLYFIFISLKTNKVLYTSESVCAYPNPTWRSFSFPPLHDVQELSRKNVLLRVYTKSECKEAVNCDKIIIEYKLHVPSLEPLNDQDESLESHMDTVLLHMFNQHFVVPSVLSLTNESCKPSVPRIESSLTVKSYAIRTLTRLRTALRVIQQINLSISEHQNSIDDKVYSSQRHIHVTKSVEEQVAIVNQLRAELLWQKSVLAKRVDTHELQYQRLQTAKVSLKDDITRLRKQKEELAERLQQFNQTRETFVKVNAQLLSRRKKLVVDLSTFIYPIQENPRGLSICDVVLPNSENIQSRDEPAVAVALGYTAHLLMKMSQLLDLPLWYAVHHHGSRSEIIDHVVDKLPNKERKFPLYWKGKEKSQFDYGIYLLNKNICQLRYYCGVVTADLRPTLSNIKTLLKLRFGLTGGENPVENKSPNLSTVKYDIKSELEGNVKQGLLSIDIESGKNTDIKTCGASSSPALSALTTSSSSHTQELSHVSAHIEHLSLNHYESPSVLNNSNHDNNIVNDSTRTSDKLLENNEECSLVPEKPNATVIQSVTNQGIENENPTPVSATHSVCNDKIQDNSPNMDSIDKMLTAVEYS